MDIFTIREKTSGTHHRAAKMPFEILIHPSALPCLPPPAIPRPAPPEHPGDAPRTYPPHLSAGTGRGTQRRCGVRVVGLRGCAPRDTGAKIPFDLPIRPTLGVG